jgi:hypothetical protein
MRKPVTNPGFITDLLIFKLNENFFSFANVFYKSSLDNSDIYDLLKPIKIHS